MSEKNGTHNGHKGTPRANKKTYSARIVAQAVAMLIAGSAVAEVSKALDIPQRTVSEWKDLVPAEFAGIRPKKEVIEELVWQNVESILRANLAQLKVASDEEWIRKHTPDSLAILYGTICDKGFRFLEAAARAEQQTRQLGPASGIEVN